MRTFPKAAVAAALALTAAACGDRVTPTAVASAASSRALIAADEGDFIVIGRNGTLPADFEARVTAAGATVQHVTPEIGIALVRGSNDAATALAAAGGVDGVVTDMAYGLEQSGRDAVEVEAVDPAAGADAVGNPPASGVADRFFNLQWGHDAIDAVEAWNAGNRGAGVRVAVLDNGIRSTHLEFRGATLNKTLSKSFVPGEAYDNPPGAHGSHTSGTIAAPQNAIGTIGVAPLAEIVMVKVLSARTGSGSSYYTMAGLVYAGRIGARVVNMSLGITVPFPRAAYWYTDAAGNRVHVTAAMLQGFIQAYQRAVDYARAHGAVVVASLGNEGADLQGGGDAIQLPAELRGVISVSATGPMKWNGNHLADFDILASYSNFGKNALGVAAPGGNFDYPGTEWCLIAGLARPCWVFDGVMSAWATSDGAYAWSWGTSMAAPHVSGVAALVIGKYAGLITPQAVEQTLRKSADDLGKPGKDDSYGDGRVNAFRAVTQ
ncbi:MAG: S8 family peptidase [Gemmatimonadaceae bacterium]